MNKLQLNNKRWRNTMKELGWAYVSFMVPAEEKPALYEYRSRLVKRWLDNKLQKQLEG